MLSFLACLLVQPSRIEDEGSVNNLSPYQVRYASRSNNVCTESSHIRCRTLDAGQSPSYQPEIQPRILVIAASPEIISPLLLASLHHV
jgi:hypothetical protein